MVKKKKGVEMVLKWRKAGSGTGESHVIQPSKNIFDQITPNHLNCFMI